MAQRVLGEGWLAAYMRYTQNQEAPDLYHFWTALSIIGGAIRRNMWVDRVDYLVFPNLYVFLVGPTGIGKSTALMTGFKLLQRIGEDQVKTFHGRISNEALFHLMSRTVKTPNGIEKDGTLFLFADELKSLLGERDYAKELMTTLTDLYSGQDGIAFQHKTISQGDNSPVLRNYLINFLAGTTQSWLGEIIKPAMFDGGAAGRIIFVTQQVGRGVSDVDPEDVREETEGLREMLASDLSYIANMRGQFRMTREARDYWKAWRKTIVRSGDTRLLGYMARKHDTVLKLAMIFSVSKDDQMTIETPHIVAAIQTLDGVEPLMLDAFSHIGSTESATGAQLLLMLERFGGKCPKYLLLRHMNYLIRDSKSFDSILQTLQMQGKVTLMKTGQQVWITHIPDRRSDHSIHAEEPSLPFGEPVTVAE